MELCHRPVDLSARNSRTPTVANEGWAPLLAVANNGTFFTDTSSYY